MKKAWVIGGVVTAHVAVVGALAVCGGCGTMGKQPPPPPPAPMEQPPMAMPPSMMPAPARIELPPPMVVAPPVKPTPAPVVTPTKKYTVKSGDSVSMIAKRFKVSKVDIMKMNKITDANKIRIGQKLTLPSYVDLNAPVPVVKRVHKAAKPAAVAVAGGGDYAVVSGDTLGGIAYRHGTTSKAIKEVNNLTSDKLQIGQKLVLPKGAAASGEVTRPEVASMEGAPLETAVTAGEPLPEPKSNEVLHVVEPNQDLSSIAMMYGVRAEEIMRLNDLASPDVKVGQTLKIPPPLE